MAQCLIKVTCPSFCTSFNERVDRIAFRATFSLSESTCGRWLDPTLPVENAQQLPRRSTGSIRLTAAPHATTLSCWGHKHRAAVLTFLRASGLSPLCRRGRFLHGTPTHDLTKSASRGHARGDSTIRALCARWPATASPPGFGEMLVGMSSETVASRLLVNHPVVS